MKLSQAVKMAFVALKGNKMRSFLTMLGIIIGVVAVTLLISVVQGATGEITGQIESLGSNLLYVTFTGERPSYLTLADLSELAEDASIAGVTGVIAKTTNVKAGDLSDAYKVEGVTRAYQQITGQDIAQGRVICDIDVEADTYSAVLGTEVADDLFGTQNCSGNTLNIEGFDFTVVGLLEASDTMLANKHDTIIIPLTTAQRLFLNKEFGALYISATSPDTVDAAQKAAEDFLTRELNDEDAYSVINQNAILDVMNEVMSVMTVLLSGIAAISLLVGGIGIMNIMLVSVTERTREIGIRKAIGAQRSDILGQFLIEAVVLSVAGGAVGVGLGFVGLHIISLAMGISMSMTAGTIALALGFSALVAWRSASTPLTRRRASGDRRAALRINPVSVPHLTKRPCRVADGFSNCGFL
jgi:putative ABC transport system permease protein